MTEKMNVIHKNNNYRLGGMEGGMDVVKKMRKKQ
jgi:hypothetical protein